MSPRVLVPFALLLAPSLAHAANNFVDSGFEIGAGNGVDYWSQSSTNGFSLIDTWAATGGDASAWLGGAHNEISEITQFVWLNHAVSSVSFDVKISSSEVCGGRYDELVVVVENVTESAYILTWIELCQDNVTSGWVTETLQFEGSPGDRFGIYIEVETDSSVLSSAYIDNVRTAP